MLTRNEAIEPFVGEAQCCHTISSASPAVYKSQGIKVSSHDSTEHCLRLALGQIILYKNLESGFYAKYFESKLVILK